MSLAQRRLQSLQLVLGQLNDIIVTSTEITHLASELLLLFRTQVAIFVAEDEAVRFAERLADWLTVVQDLLKEIL